MPEKVKQLTEDSNILKLLFILTIPTVISGLVDTLYNTVDSIFVGQFVGSEGLAALAIINVIQLLFLAIGVLFSVGNASIISRALGAHHIERAKSSLIHTFWALFIISNLISYSILFNLESFLMFIGASEKTLPYAKSYGEIILWTGFFVPINNMLMGSFRAKGEVLKSTYLNSAGAILNIILDAIFIMKLDMGVGGAALATAISQGIVFVIAIIRVMKLYQINFLFHHKEEINPNIVGEIIQVGLPTGLRLLLFTAVFSIANVILAPYGDDYLSAFGIFNRFIMILSMINISLSIGSQPLIGMNYGAKLYDRVQKIITLVLLIGFGVSVLTCFFLWFAPYSAYALFTSDSNIIRICREISIPQAYTYIGWGFFICIAEALQAMGRAKKSFWLSMTYPTMVIFGFIVFDKFWGLEGTYWAFPFSYVVIGIASVIILKTEFQHLHHKNEALKNIF